MDEWAPDPWYATVPDDEDESLSAEEGDPAVSAAIVASAALVLVCAAFLVSGLPGRLHAAFVHAAPDPAHVAVGMRGPSRGTAPYR